jgi:hypothetical protein
MHQIWYTLIGALLWPALVGIAWLWGSRRGALSGFWLQLAYGPDDENMSGRVWSIEIVQARQLGHHLRGTMWRVYPVEFERRWHFVGRRDKDTLRGLYTVNRSTGGGNGLFHLLGLGEGTWSGQFLHSYAEAAGKSEAVLHREDYALEWIRLRRLRKGPLTEWLEGMAPDVRELYPPHVRRMLWNDLSFTQSLSLRFSAAAALVDPRPLLEYQRAMLAEAALSGEAEVADAVYVEIKRADIVDDSVTTTGPKPVEVDGADEPMQPTDAPPDEAAPAK